MIHRYTSTFVVTKEHLDELNHVNNVQYLLWAQEVAKAHWGEINKLIKVSAAVWMVRNQEVNYRMGGFLGDSIRIETYVKEVRGSLSLRIVEFYNDKTHQLLVSCKTQWCWVELENRKPLKITDQIKKLFLSSKVPF